MAVVNTTIYIFLLILICFLISNSTFEHFYLQCSSIFSLVMVFTYYLLSFFSNVSDSEHCELNEILAERSIFQYNIQKSVPRSLQLKKMFFWRIEICIWDLKFQRQIRQEIIDIDKRKSKMFIRFVSKLVFRVSGKSALWDIPVTSKRIDIHILPVMFKCCL